MVDRSNWLRTLSGMVYFHLGLAIVFEVGWALAMKLSHGLTRFWPTVATLLMYLLSIFFLSLATKKLDVGHAYAIWAGSGAALIALAGILFFREPAGALKLASMAFIAVGIIGLQYSGGGH
jgi:multidrug transporter EmrE-like cation transporter